MVPRVRIDPSRENIDSLIFRNTNGIQGCMSRKGCLNSLDLACRMEKGDCAISLTSVAPRMLSGAPSGVRVF